MSLVFLGVADVIRIHADQVEAYGGSDGIRDERLLDSAISQASAPSNKERHKLHYRTHARGRTRGRP